MSIDHLFDTTKDNAHLVQVDSFEAAAPTATKPVSTATEKQLNFLKSLFAERKNNEEAQIVREHLLEEYRNGNLTKLMASQAIEDVKTIPRDPVPGRSEVPWAAEHGQVWVTTGGLFVRIKESNSTGNLYGLVWDYDQEKWNYTPGITRELDHRITVEEASAWGHEHQWCIFCSRALSDPRSEYAGYGEVCARKHRLPWGEVAETDAVINEPTTEKEDVYEYPYGQGQCRICLQPRPYVLNGFLRGCNC